VVEGVVEVEGRSVRISGDLEFEEEGEGGLMGEERRRDCRVAIEGDVDI